MKRCIKFTGYIYLPSENGDMKEAKYRINNPRPGRIEIFDEDNNKTGERMKAFVNYDEMCEKLDKVFKVRSKKVMKNWK